MGAEAPLLSLDIALAVAFVRRTIGKPWEEGAIGPDTFDCWGLTRACQRDVFGRPLPIVEAKPGETGSVDRDDLRAVVKAIKSHEARQDWEIVGKPMHGDIVTMAHHIEGKHIGTYLGIDRGGFLHATRDAGVCFDKLAVLRVKGWMRLEFYRYRGAAA